MAAAFPNVTPIDVAETVALFASKLQQLFSVVRFFTAFSVLAGVLILVSSVFSTRMVRLQEAVYYKIFGGTRAFVWRVFAFESLLLGLFSGLLSLVLSNVAAYLICTRLLETKFVMLPGTDLVMLVATTGIILFFGLVPSVTILQEKPASYLRDHA